jgi:hypothetical protein
MTEYELMQSVELLGPILDRIEAIRIYKEPSAIGVEWCLGGGRTFHSLDDVKRCVASFTNTNTMRDA